MRRFNTPKNLFLVLSIWLAGCVVTVPAPHYSGTYYDYYYYPSVRVYFQIGTGFYFYINDGVWVRTRVLPPHIRLHPHDRYYLNIHDIKPYIKEKEHIKKIPQSRDYRPDIKHDRIERESNRNIYDKHIKEKNLKDKKRKK